MLNILKIATKDSFIYSLGNASTKIIGLILLPLYTEKLTVAEYGVLGTVEVTIQILIAVFSLSLRQALNRWYWDKDYKYKQKSIFFTTLFTTGIGVLIMLIIFLPFSKSLSVSLFESEKYAFLFKLMLISAGFQIINRVVFSLMRLQRKALLFSITNITKLLVTLGLTIYFIVALKMGIEGIVGAQIIGFLFALLVNMNFIIKNIVFVFERSILKEMIAFSYPLAISSVSSVLLTVTDRYAVRYIGGMEAMGLYSLGFKVANVLKIFVINSIGASIRPLKFQMMNKPGNKRFYSKILTYSAFVFIMIMLFLSMFSQEVIKFFTSDSQYWGAYQIVPVLCFAQLFELLKRNVNFGLIVEKKTKIISSIIVIISILNVGINIGMVYFFGAIGAAVSALSVQIIFFTMTYYYAQKYYPINYELRKILLMIFLGAVIVIITFVFINSISFWPRVLIKILLIISYPILLYFVKFYDPVELERLRGTWEKWKNPIKWKNNLKKIKIK